MSEAVITPDVPEVPDVPPVPSQETEAQGTKTTRKQNVLPKYPIPEGGLSSVPEDYSAGKYQPLRKRDFSDEIVYHQYKIDSYKSQIASHEAAISDIKKFGANPEAAKQAKAINKLMDNLTKLAEQKVEGIDFSEFLKGKLAEMQGLLAQQG